MEPQVRFCTSGDGTRVAYATVGAGRPLVMLLGWSTSFDAEWKDAEGRTWTEQLARGRRLIRCERRGSRATAGGSVDLSIDAQAGDLSAVADHLGLDQFDLLGAYDGASVAVAYASRHPERIARLVLWAPFARGSDVGNKDQLDSFARLCMDSWRLARRSWAGQVFPSGPPERGRWYSELVKEWFTPEVAAGYMNLIRDLDITGLLGGVQAPTLVLARDRDRVAPAAASRVVASMLPNATFTSTPGDEGYLVFGDTSYLDTMNRFLDEDASIETTPSPGTGTAIILFADIVDSTALTERMGDAAFRERARKLDASLRKIITDSGGSAIDGKLLGDGVLATFPAASQAIDAALRCAVAGNDGALPLHLGIHAGDVIREQNNVFGGAVNIASRISGLSAPGEVLVSDIVRGLARTSAGVAFEDRGEHALKGVADAQRVYAVRRDS